MRRYSNRKKKVKRHKSPRDSRGTVEIPEEQVTPGEKHKKRINVKSKRAGIMLIPRIKLLPRQNPPSHMIKKIEKKVERVEF